jgi:hypothetical protein
VAAGAAQQEGEAVRLPTRSREGGQLRRQASQQLLQQAGGVPAGRLARHAWSLSWRSVLVLLSAGPG